MRVKDRAPTLRWFGLVAIFIAAGLFTLRAYVTFSGPQSTPVGSAVEQHVTYLLEPITGNDKVRVSISGLAPKVILVMVDGDMATDLRPQRARIESILVAAIGFDPERDTLTLTQFPYAAGVGSSLTALEIGELLALGGLTALLLTLWLVRAPMYVEEGRPSDEPRAPVAISHPSARLTPSAPPLASNLSEAADLAEKRPNETAELVRNWMSHAED